MLKPETIAGIKRLLAEDQLSQRRIAKLLGVSRGSVCNVENGNWDCRRLLRAERAANNRTKPAGPIERCPDCGAMAATPCRACQIRRLLRKAGVELHGSLPGGARAIGLTLDLKPADQSRYEEVRRRESGDRSQEEKLFEHRQKGLSIMGDMQTAEDQTIDYGDEAAQLWTVPALEARSRPH